MKIGGKDTLSIEHGFKQSNMLKTYLWDLIEVVLFKLFILIVKILNM